MKRLILALCLVLISTTAFATGKDEIIRGSTSISANSCAAGTLATGIGSDGALVCGKAIGTDVQAYSAILAGLAAVTPTNNGIFGYNNSGTLGLYTNHMHDDSAAQFYSATASKGTMKFVQSSISDGILLTVTPVVTGNATITTESYGAGTYTLVDKTSTQTLTGKTITVSATEFIPVAWMIDGAAPPDALATVDLGTRQVKARTFAADSSKDLEFFWQAPADIVDGDSGTAGFQVKWRPIYVITHATAPASGEGVVFALSSCSSGDSDTGNCTVGDDSVVAYADLDGHAQYDLVYGTYTAMTVTDGAAGEAWMMKVYRDHDHASDDYGQVVGLIGIEIKYVRNLTNGY